MGNSGPLNAILPPPHPLAYVDSAVEPLFLIQQARYSELQTQQLRQAVLDGSLSVSPVRSPGVSSSIQQTYQRELDRQR